MNNLIRFFLFINILLFPSIIFSQWQPTGGPAGGGSIVLENEDYLFAYTHSQWNRSADLGDTWEKINQGLPYDYNLYSRTINKTNLFIITKFDDSNFGAYLSLNNGEYWSMVTLPDTKYPYSTLGVLQDKTFLEYNGELLESSDLGLTWDSNNLNDSISSSILQIVTHADKLYIVTKSDGLFFSQDQGESWENVVLPFDADELENMFFHDSILAIKRIESPYIGKIYFSNNNGNTWVESPSSPDTYVQNIAIWNGEIYKINSDRLFKSTDLGASWTLIYQGTLSGIDIKDGVIFTNKGSNIYRSYDFGMTFEKLETPFVGGNAIFSLKYQDGLLYSGVREQLKVINPTGWDWENVNILLDSLLFPSDILTDINISGDTIIIFTAYKSLVISFDKGITWTDKTLAGTNGATFWTGLNFDYIDNNFYIYRHGLYRSQDLGNTWEDYQTILYDQLGAISSFISGHKNSLFIGSNKGVYRSDDNGQTWYPKNNGITFPDTSGTVSARLFYSLNDKIFVDCIQSSSSKVNLFMSEDNGESWVSAGSGLPLYIEDSWGVYASDLPKMKKAGDYLIFFTKSNIYASDDGGLHWFLFDNEFEKKITAIETIGDNLIGASYLEGVLEQKVDNVEYNIFTGRVYEDLNNNQLLDPFEKFLPGIDLALPEVFQNTTTEVDGTYEVYVPLSGSTVAIIPPSPYAYIYPSIYDLNDTNTSYNFGIHLFPFSPVNGKVFIDENSNGIFDLGEQNVPGSIAKFANYPAITVSDSLGEFIVTAPAYDTLKILPPSKYMVSNPPFHVTSPDSTAYNFAINYIPGIYDLSIDITADMAAIRGSNVKYYLTIRNEGTEVIDAGVQLEFDSQIELISSTIFPNSTNNNILEWSLPALNISEFVVIKLEFYLPPNLALNSKIIFSGSVQPLNNIDYFTGNNLAILNQKIIGSFDPNDKLVEPEGSISTLQLQDENYLDYTIRFQNTGNYLAAKVIIIDTLDTDLDHSTFRIISHSHPLVWNILDGGIVEFIFDDINLPDSVSNEAESHGFVKYTIKCKNDISAGEEVQNTAHIYFDFNDPIATNTTTSKIIRIQYESFTNVELCQGEYYNNILINKDTALIDTVAFEHYDSLYITNIYTNPTYQFSIDTLVSVGDLFFNSIIYADTIIIQDLFTINSCDSTVIYNVGILTNSDVNNFHKKELLVSPNPTLSVLSVKVISESFEIGTASIFSSAGNLVLNKQIETNTSFDIDLSILTPGVYFVRYKDEEDVFFKKIIKN
jgi:photosystem II stability/assembly factor-like uncharacterized protein